MNSLENPDEPEPGHSSLETAQSELAPSEFDLGLSNSSGSTPVIENTEDPNASQEKEVPGVSPTPDQAKANSPSLPTIADNISVYLEKTMLDQADMEAMLINSLFVKNSRRYYQTRLEDLNALFKLNVDLSGRLRKIKRKAQ